jgi:hypothetical protein
MIVNSTILLENSMAHNNKAKIPRTRLFVDLPTPLYKALEEGARQNFVSKATYVSEALKLKLNQDAISINSEELVNRD